MCFVERPGGTALLSRTKYRELLVCFWNESMSSRKLTVDTNQCQCLNTNFVPNFGGIFTERTGRKKNRGNNDGLDEQKQLDCDKEKIALKEKLLSFRPKVLLITLSNKSFVLVYCIETKSKLHYKKKYCLLDQMSY